MSVVSQRPRRQYEVLHWGHVDLQEYANGRFVSNNYIFIIVFFNTYYHKQINKILISACNETFRQSSDPVYAHTPMRNVGRLRTFNPKLLISACNETFRQSSDPVYAHTPMRNVGRLRTFNPKLKDSAGGEVNNQTEGLDEFLFLLIARCLGFQVKPGGGQINAMTVYEQWFTET